LAKCAATARLAAQAGYRVALAARRRDRLAALVDELGGSERAVAIGCDVTNYNHQERMVATIRIAYRGLSQSFTTENFQQRPHRIEMKLRDGPFSRLHGVWTFKALTDSACRVDLEMDYEMRSGLVSQLMGPVFGQIAQTMVDAFVNRAEALAGGL